MDELKIKQLSLGRFDFCLPIQFELIGRHQSIYFVEIWTNPLQDQSPEILWQLCLTKINDENTFEDSTYKITWIGEINPGFPFVFYQPDSEEPTVTLEAQKTIENHLLLFKYDGKKGMEKEILRLISIIADEYQYGIPYGFNVGLGSVTSIPGINEQAFAKFVTENLKTEVSIYTQTVGNILNDKPLDDISNEIKHHKLEGIDLKVLKDNERIVSEFSGFEGLILLDFPNEEPIFRYTWFFQGEKTNSFKPEILIECTGPASLLDSWHGIWENLLKSFSPRKMK
jgi:hypothetical protein